MTVIIEMLGKVVNINFSKGKTKKTTAMPDKKATIILTLGSG